MLVEFDYPPNLKQNFTNNPSYMNGSFYYFIDSYLSRSEIILHFWIFCIMCEEIRHVS